MNLFQRVAAARKLASVLQGETEILSVAEVAVCILNMKSASRNLPAEQFRRLKAAFDGMTSVIKQEPVNRDRLDEIEIGIFKGLDWIAPLEAYTDTSDPWTMLHIAQSRGDEKQERKYRRLILELMLNKK